MRTIGKRQMYLLGCSISLLVSIQACQANLIGTASSETKNGTQITSEKNFTFEEHGKPNSIAIPEPRSVLSISNRDPKFVPPSLSDPGVKIIANPLEEENMATHPALLKGRTIPERFPKKKLSAKRSLLTASTTHCGWGVDFIGGYTAPSVFYARSRHTVNKTQTLPWNGGAQRDSIYAPTMLPPFNSSLEGLTIYDRAPLWPTSGVNFAVYDHSLGNYFTSFKVWMDATTTTFTNHYLNSASQYDLLIYKFSNGYEAAYLWDYISNAWALMYQEANGTSGHPTNGGYWRAKGWNMFEVSYDNYDPGTIQTVTSDIIKLDLGDGKGEVWATKSSYTDPNGVVIPQNSLDGVWADPGNYNVVNNWYTHTWISYGNYRFNWSVSNP